MNFSEIEARYRELASLRAVGQLTPEAFADAVNALRIQDARGRWWQMDPWQGHWLAWDGKAWVAATPEVARSDMPDKAARSDMPDPGVSPPAAAKVGAGETAAGGENSAPDWPRRILGRFTERLMTPGEFMRQGRLPIGERSQGWWDVLAIGGGALSGNLWFVYSSIRGMPHLKFLGGGGGREAWFDFLPMLALLLLPLIVYGLRRSILTRFDHLLARVRVKPVFGLQLGGGVLGGLFLLQALGPTLFGWAFNFREGLDLTTPLLMVAMPVAITLLRRELDKLLAPLQAFRRQIPRWGLIGMAIVAPFAVSFILYGLRFSQYELLHANVVLGTLASYALLRNPASAGGGRGGAPLAMSLAWLALGAILLLAGAYAPDVMADDCTRDLFNMRDCLRTDGYAQVISGTATSVVSILVNGSEIGHVLVQPPPKPPTPAGGDQPGSKEGEEEKVRQFRVQVMFRDSFDKERKVFYADVRDAIFVSAWVEEITEKGTVAVASAITMTLNTATRWAVLTPVPSNSAATVMCLQRADLPPFEPDFPVDAISMTVSATVPTSATPITVPLHFGVRRMGIRLSAPGSPA